jgi:hypothetical protein
MQALIPGEAGGQMTTDAAISVTGLTFTSVCMKTGRSVSSGCRKNILFGTRQTETKKAAAPCASQALLIAITREGARNQGKRLTCGRSVVSFSG